MASARFLTEEEKAEVKARLKEDRTSLADEYDIKYVKAALGDWKIWIHMLITIGTLPLLPPLTWVLINFLKDNCRATAPGIGV